MNGKQVYIFANALCQVSRTGQMEVDDFPGEMAMFVIVSAKKMGHDSALRERAEPPGTRKTNLELEQAQP